MVKRGLLVLVAVLAWTSTHAGTKQVRLKADRVVLRLQPSFRAEVVTQVRKGDILESAGSDGDWIQVLPPEDVYYYVHSDYVTKGLVTGARVRVRTGPGIGHAVVEELQKGERVDVKGTWEGWIKITPPKGCSLWVHKTLVEDVPRSPGPKPDPVRDSSVVIKGREDGAVKTAPAPRAVSVPVAMPPPATKVSKPRASTAVVTAPVVAGGNTAEREPPAAITKRGLVPLDGQGRIATYNGLVDRQGFLAAAIKKYRLVRTDEKARGTVCYVMGNSSQLASLVGCVVSIAGREYWVRGEKLPVLVAEEIVVRQRPMEARRR